MAVDLWYYEGFGAVAFFCYASLEVTNPACCEKNPLSRF